MAPVDHTSHSFCVLCTYHSTSEHGSRRRLDCWNKIPDTRHPSASPVCIHLRQELSITSHSCLVRVCAVGCGDRVWPAYASSCGHQHMCAQTSGVSRKLKKTATHFLSAAVDITRTTIPTSTSPVLEREQKNTDCTAVETASIPKANLRKFPRLYANEQQPGLFVERLGPLQPARHR